MQKRKLGPGIYIPVLFILSVFLILGFYRKTERNNHFMPGYEKADLKSVLEKNSFTDEDYTLLFYQTGLAPYAINRIMSESVAPIDIILGFQETFFAPVTVNCCSNTIISREESLADTTALLAPCDNGAVLVTTASHVLFYRNGHAGLLLDSKSGTTLEAAVLGSDSSIQNAEKWQSFPNFAILRLKTSDARLMECICSTALQKLKGIPYHLTAGLFEASPDNAGKINGTHCSHLVWCAYYLNGIDLNTDNGLIVTPHDLLNSDLLEPVQIYGLNPSDFADRLLSG